jgi:Mn-dependent DtxR family transcriptional regulator
MEERATTTIEEYIEVICSLAKKRGSAHTNDIALKLKVKPPSVTEMLQKLYEMGIEIFSFSITNHLGTADIHTNPAVFL